MTYLSRYISFFLLALAASTSTASYAQQAFRQVEAPATVAAPLAQDQLAALLAPIALYPDQLLAQVLMASTYPIDVTLAARFVQQNPSLSGDALDRALQEQNWDASVLSLTAYPQVLLMMNDMLDWTQRLGNAFLANQQQVMQTVQILRSRALAAGNLQSSSQQTVMEHGGFIDIEPAQPQYVYVPVYDPAVIYGPWSGLDSVPAYWYPPAAYGYLAPSPRIGAGIFFGAGRRISYNHWGWARPNWRDRGIELSIGNSSFATRRQYVDRWRDGRWAHVPEQHGGAVYRDSGRPNGYVRPDNAVSPAHDVYRTREFARPPQSTVPARPQPQQDVTRAMVPPQPQSARFMPQQEPAMARPVPQPPQGVTRVLAQPQQQLARPMLPPEPAMARPVPQAPQGAMRGLAPPQQQIARAMPQLQQPIARSLPQPSQETVRSLPEQSRTW